MRKQILGRDYEWIAMKHASDENGIIHIAFREPYPMYVAVCNLCHTRTIHPKKDPGSVIVFKSSGNRDLALPGELEDALTCQCTMLNGEGEWDILTGEQVND